jgi:hypothetical protein
MQCDGTSLSGQIELKGSVISSLAPESRHMAFSLLRSRRW